MNFLSLISNFFGLVNGKIFGEPPLYVIKDKAPGMTPIPKPSLYNWIINAPFVLITTPNFVWASLALITYFYFPYDLSPNSLAAQGPFTYNFLIQRFPIWFTLVFGYTGFWHITLHILELSSRPYIKNRPYNINKLFHNMFWTLSGVFIWTLFENVFCYLWSTNRLIFNNNKLGFALALLGIPLWRSWHFYFAHRLLHFGPLYNQVHSLHHRNTDVEPFSGLCMHPIEHLYYYSCILPSLIFTCSPFAFLWNGVHLLLSPAASHSGWEDHFQSDTFHYLHHRYFECNYAGLDASFMDVLFGTFKANLDEPSPKPREDSKSNLIESIKPEFVKYLSLCSICFGIWLYFVYNKIIMNSLILMSIASLVGFGPVIIAYIINNSKNNIKSVKMNNLGMFIHIFIGFLFCNIPITYICYLTLL